jgi:23S rRNA pseudouridine1911/1915/1917 synthase
MSNTSYPSIPNLLYEDNHLLVVNKPPAGMLTQSDRSGAESLLDLGREYIRGKYAKKWNVFLGMVHRLDRPVSGVIVFARTLKAASRCPLSSGAARWTNGTVLSLRGDWKGPSSSSITWSGRVHSRAPWPNRNRAPRRPAPVCGSRNGTIRVPR